MLLAYVTKALIPNYSLPISSLLAIYYLVGQGWRQSDAIVKFRKWLYLSPLDKICKRKPPLLSKTFEIEEKKCT